MAKLTNVCEICRRDRPLTYHRGRDEYICDGCWDELPPQSTDDKSEPDEGSMYEVAREQSVDRGPGAYEPPRRVACNHNWVNDPTCDLIDICTKCGEERA